jgi:hypothetical protein
MRFSQIQSIIHNSEQKTRKTTNHGKIGKNWIELKLWIVMNSVQFIGTELRTRIAKLIFLLATHPQQNKTKQTIVELKSCGFVCVLTWRKENLGFLCACSITSLLPQSNFYFYLCSQPNLPRLLGTYLPPPNYPSGLWSWALLLFFFPLTNFVNNWEFGKFCYSSGSNSTNFANFWERNSPNSPYHKTEPPKKKTNPSNLFFYWGEVSQLGDFFFSENENFVIMNLVAN